MIKINVKEVIRSIGSERQRGVLLNEALDGVSRGEFGATVALMTLYERLEFQRTLLGLLSEITADPIASAAFGCLRDSLDVTLDQFFTWYQSKGVVYPALVTELESFSALSKEQNMLVVRNGSVWGKRPIYCQFTN